MFQVVFAIKFQFKIRGLGENLTYIQMTRFVALFLGNTEDLEMLQLAYLYFKTDSQ